MSRRITAWLIRFRYPIFAVLALLVASAYPLASNVSFDRSIENMFSSTDPLLEPFQRLKREFGGNEVVLAVYRDEALLDPDGEGIKRLAILTKRLREVDGVEDVLSLSVIGEALGEVQKLGRIKSIIRIAQGDSDSEPTAILKQDDELAISFLQLFEGYTHDKTGTIAACVCMLTPEGIDQPDRRTTIDELRNVIEHPASDRNAGMIAGEPVMVVDGFRFVEADGARLGWASTILLGLVIIACFRSVRWVLIPIVVMQSTIWLTMAILTLVGLQLSMVSSMLTAIVTVISVATVVHIIVRFRQARRLGWNTNEAIFLSGLQLSAPIAFACLTDAVGFISLIVANVGPVRDFGIMMSIGSIVVLITVAGIVPMLVLIGKWDTDPQRVWGEDRLDSALKFLIDSPGQFKAMPIICAAILVSLLSCGVLWLRVETDFTKNFRRESEIARSYTFIEEHLGGAGVLDISVPAPKVLHREYVKRVLDLENELRSIKSPTTGQPALSKVISMIDAIDAAEKGNKLIALIPSNIRGETIAVTMAATMPTFAKALRFSPTAEEVAQGKNARLRIMVRSPERQSAEEKLWLIDQIEIKCRQAFPKEDDDPPQVTGFFVLLANLIKSLLRDQWICFAIASVGIWVMMTLAFRSPRFATIAMIPNAIPIFVLLGTMGWLGVPMNMGAAMIAAVSIGISVDSSIHYILMYARCRRAGQPFEQALYIVQQMVGRALVFSTLALIVGFTVLCFSEFIPTIYFGGLVSLCMLGGLAGNLVILPTLLRASET